MECLGKVNLILQNQKNIIDLNDKFILNPGFNFRNNEIGAVIGINQIKDWIKK